MNQNTLHNLTVQLTDVIFYDADSSFTIATASSAENKNITIVGYLRGGIPGEVVDAKGYWRTDNVNEARFYVEKFTKSLPVTISGIKQYLNCGLFEGLNPELTDCIVKQFGTQTPDILTHNSEKLKYVDTINDEAIQKITASWQKHLTINQITDFLHQISVSPAFAAPIYHKLGVNAINKIKTNPFILVSEINGISYITASFIARQLNIDFNNIDNIKYGVISLLEDLAQKGHAYYPYAKLLALTIKKLGLKPEPAADAIARATAENEIVIKDLNKCEGHYVLNNKAVYLKANYNCEQELALALKQYLAAPLNPKFETLDLPAKIDALKNVSDIVKNHLKNIMANKCCIVDECIKHNKRNMLKAIDLLGKETGLTILSFSVASSYVQYKKHYNSLPDIHDEINAANRKLSKFNGDIIVITQSSRLNTFEMHAIMQRMPAGAMLILTGDSNHLPPKGPGQFFYDLMRAEIVPVIRLNDMDTSKKPLNLAVRAFFKNTMPQIPEFSPFELEKHNLYFIEQDTTEKIIKTISTLYAKRLPKALNLNQTDIQVICLANKGPLGAKKLNLLLQERLNKRNGGLKHNGFIFRVNEKIIQTVDNAQKKLSYGQTGIIQTIDMHQKAVNAVFNKQNVTYAFNELIEIKPAWAIPINKVNSVHKVVILPLHCDAYTNLNRMALYSVFMSTGHTLIIVGQKRAFKIAMENSKIKKRHTGLKELLLT